jgi:uncharacterized protein (DUF1697 family)
MITYIALLRGINVGGHKKVAMSELRDFATALGFEDVQTLLNSGNLVLRGEASSGPALERLLEEQAETRLSLRTAFFVRTAKELDAMIASNPFPAEAKSDPGHLVVQFLKDAPGAGAVKALQEASKGPEIVRADGKQLYVVYPAGIGRSKLTADLMERSLGTRGTGRNWNTVLKLGALAQA